MTKPRHRIVTTCQFYPAADAKAPVPDSRWAYEKTSKDSSRFAPHIVIGDPDQREPVLDNGEGIPRLIEDYLGVGFWDGDTPIVPGKDLRVAMDLISQPSHSAGKVRLSP